MPTLVIELPLETISELNAREHWRAKANRVKKQRQDAHMLCLISGKGFVVPKNATLDIMLTRLAPRKLDSDNLASAFKAIRDGIADWLGINDGSDRITWTYAQEYLAKTRSVIMTLEVKDA
jgi:hypothetical protein